MGSLPGQSLRLPRNDGQYRNWLRLRDSCRETPISITVMRPPSGDTADFSLLLHLDEALSPRFFPFFICLDTYMLFRVYKENGICIRNHCGAEPPRDLEPAGLVAAVGGRDRASASYAAADRVEAPARAARGRFRGVHGGRTAPSLPAETGTISGGGCLAGSVPPVLVRSRGCSRTPPRPHGSVNTEDGQHHTKKKDKRRRRGPNRERDKGETK